MSNPSSYKIHYIDIIYTLRAQSKKQTFDCLTTVFFLSSVEADTWSLCHIENAFTNIPPIIKIKDLM